EKPVEIKHFLVEDVEKLKNEKALFHLFNQVIEGQGKLLLTSTNAPEQLAFKLPDLLSRLKGAQQVNIMLPDDEMLKTLLLKQFSDKQLRVSPEVIGYLVSRMPRSFIAIKEIVHVLDQSSLEQRRN